MEWVRRIARELETGVGGSIAIRHGLAEPDRGDAAG